MYFALLGRLRLRIGSGVVGLPGPVSRSIVARLLLARGDVVQRDTLIDELWGEREARNPANALQVQITKLRAALAAQGEEGRLESRHDGYRLVLGPQDELDAALFEAAVREGGAGASRTRRTRGPSGVYATGCRCGRAGPWTIWTGLPSTPSAYVSKSYG